jgi:hypothetical protein
VAGAVLHRQARFAGNEKVHNQTNLVDVTAESRAALPTAAALSEQR